MEVIKISFPTFSGNVGSLSFMEAEGHIPFPIQRVYYIYDVPEGVRRGFHAHKKLRQVLICLHGSCKILLDDTHEKHIVSLTSPSEGLLIEHAVWREMYDFSPGAVLMVLASEHYSEEDYIRDYDQFLTYMEENEK